MAATLSDSNILSGDAGFIGRVRAAMVQMALNVTFEAWTVAFHRERQAYAVGILNSPDAFKQLFANTTALDANVIGDATQAGTVALTAGNVATQAALVTDAHITTSVTGTFPSFFRTPAT